MPKVSEQGGTEIMWKWSNMGGQHSQPAALCEAALHRTELETSEPWFFSSSHLPALNQSGWSEERGGDVQGYSSTLLSLTVA